MNDQRRFLIAFLLIGTTLPCVPGCGSRQERGEVDGVLLAKGKPLANVLVKFVLDAEQSRQAPTAAGVTDTEGRFRLKSSDKADGVVVGTYRVTLEDLNLLNAERSKDGTVLRAPPSRFPAHYGDLLKTPLRHSVVVGTQKVELTLKDAP